MIRHTLAFAGLGLALFTPSGCSDSTSLVTDASSNDTSGLRDARPGDASVVDARILDARVVDARVVDARVIDAAAQTADARVVDAAVPTADARIADARVIDARIVDARIVDARIPDAAGPTPDAAPPGPGPTIGGCPVFPANDPWNQDVLDELTDDVWTAKLSAHALHPNTNFHPDFGNGFGIPINVVPMSEPKLPISFDIDDESDPGPYPFSASVDIEGGTPTNCGGDCHVLVVQQGSCILWEAWACELGGSAWQCGSGAKFDMTAVGPGQRPKRWTSADAAGLAITPGLVRYAEVAAGSVNHAIRFTMHCTQDGFVDPASHQAVPRRDNVNCPEDIDTDTLRADYPPMGTRVRLKASYPTDGLPYQARIVAEAMKKYGMILADNGSDYFFQGEDNPNWDDDQLNALKNIPGDQLEVLTMPPIQR